MAWRTMPAFVASRSAAGWLVNSTPMTWPIWSRTGS